MCWYGVVCVYINPSQYQLVQHYSIIHKLKGFRVHQRVFLGGLLIPFVHPNIHPAQTIDRRVVDHTPIFKFSGAQAPASAEWLLHICRELTPFSTGWCYF